MKKILVGLATAFFLAVPAIAAAEGQPRTRTCPPGEDCTEYVMGEDDILGQIIRPDGSIIPGRSRGASRSLVNPRTHFIPELVKSVEDI